MLLLAFAPFLGGSRDLFAHENFKVHGLRIVLNVMVTTILTYCYKIFPIANVYTMIFTMPFFAAIMAIWIYREAAANNRWIAIAVGFLGVLIAMRPWSADFQPLLLLPLGSAVLITVLYISARSLNNPSLFSIGFPPIIGTAILISPLAFNHFSPLDPMHVPIFAILSLCAATGIICVSLAYRVTAASVVAPFLYSEMIWALAFGYCVFHDTPNWMMLIGAAIIIGSGIYLVETERRNMPMAGPPIT